eukprot:5820409-Amphidinium_carterae.2
MSLGSLRHRCANSATDRADVIVQPRTFSRQSIQAPPEVHAQRLVTTKSGRCLFKHAYPQGIDMNLSKVAKDQPKECGKHTDTEAQGPNSESESTLKSRNQKKTQSMGDQEQPNQFNTN